MEAKYTDRETAREILVAKAARLRAAINDPNYFSTYDPAELLRDTEWRLRWIECAPEGANHLTAPLQDKRGVPCGGVIHETVFGAESPHTRFFRVRRGNMPFGPHRAMTTAERERFEPQYALERMDADLQAYVARTQAA